jgi:hypothetical protein
MCRLAYQPPASIVFLSEQTSHQQAANNIFLSEQISTCHQPNERANEMLLTGIPLTCMFSNMTGY